MMRSSTALAIIVAATLAVASAPRSSAEDAAANAASAELFLRTFAVFSHARCSNCHPQDDRPRQGTTTRHVHAMNVQRGREKTGGTDAGGYGRPGMECRTCHQE